MEEKRCPRCGEYKPIEQFTKGGKGGWCKECHATLNREWRARKRNGLPPRENNKYTEEQKNEWRRYVAEHGSIKDAAEYFSVDDAVIWRAAHKEFSKYKERRDADILRLRAENMSMQEIADTLGIESNFVGYICRKNGMGGRIKSPWEGPNTEAQMAGRKKTAQKIKDGAENRMKEQLQLMGLEYLGGYTDSNGLVRFRWIACGHEGQLTCWSLRHNKKARACPICAKEERQRKTDEIRREKESKKTARQELKEKEEKEREQKRHKICKECGKPFYDDSNSNRAYCSEKCSKRSANRKKDARRRGYKANGTLTKLYERDGGRCYICGCTCDFFDHEIIDGAFVVGPTYPTVEHVIPICMGGDDSAQNIKLACHRCNSIKGRRSNIKVGATGQIAWAI